MGPGIVRRAGFSEMCGMLEGKVSGGEEVWKKGQRE